MAASHMWVLYETNDLDRVEQIAARFREDIATSAVPEFIAVAHLALARTHELRGRRHAAPCATPGRTPTSHPITSSHVTITATHPAGKCQVW
jgi:hypothetical protein